MNRTPEEIENDVARTRREIDETADALRDKMSPGQLMDELMRSFGGSEILGNLGRQVRDNPMPLVMIGAGMAWLMAGDRQGRHGVAAEPSSWAASETGGVADETVDAGEGDAGGAIAMAKDALHDAKDKAASAVDAAKSKASDAAASAREGVRTAAERTGHAAHKVQDSFMSVMERDPLVMGALGVALGAAVGAALPSTRLEDRYVGPLRDKALDKGKEALNEAEEATLSIARRARDEADRRGLGDDVRSFAEDAEQVARSAADQAKQEFRDRTGH